MRSVIIFLLVVAVLGGGGYMAAKYLKPAGVEVPTALAKRGEFTIRTYARGDMRTLRSSVVTSPNVGSGLIVTRLVGTGETVKAGDVVMEFDPADLENALEANKASILTSEQSIVSQKAGQAISQWQDQVNLMRAQYAVRQAKLNCKQNELLAEIDAQKNDLNLKAAERRLAQTEQDIVSTQRSQQADLRVAEQQLNTAKFNMNLTQQRIDRLVVKSTLNGLASIRDNQRAAGGFQMVGQDMPAFREGDSISSGDAVLDIVDTEQMEVAGKVPEITRGNLHEGQDVNIHLDSLPGEVFPGKVKTLSGLTARDMRGVDPTKTFDVVFSLSKQNDRLRPGMTAEVEIITDRLPNVIYVPLQAVFDRDGKKIVYVKQGDKYLPAEVTLGARSESQVVVEKGLKGEEQVALLDPEARAATGSTKKSSVAKAIGK